MMDMIFLRLRMFWARLFARKLTGPVDEVVINNLLSLGVDTNIPREIEFFLYVPDHETAENLCTVLRQDGYTCQASDNPFPPLRGGVFATKVLPPTNIIMENERIKLTELATRFGGVYDGWGTGVVRE